MFRNDFGFRTTKAVLPVAMLCVLSLPLQAEAQEFDLISQQPAKTTQNEEAPSPVDKTETNRVLEEEGSTPSPQAITPNPSSKTQSTASNVAAVESDATAVTQGSWSGSVCATCDDSTIVITNGSTSQGTGEIVYTAMQGSTISPSQVGQACSGPGCCACNNAQPAFSSTPSSVVYADNYVGQSVQPGTVYHEQNYAMQSYPVQSYPAQSYPTQSYSTPSHRVAQPVVSNCSTCNNYASQENVVELDVINGVNANYVPTSSSYSTPTYVAPQATYVSAVPNVAPVTSVPANVVSPQPVYYSTPTYNSQPTYSAPAPAYSTPTFSAPVYSSPSPSRFDSTSRFRTGGQSGLAQSKAIQAAQMGLRGHLGGGLGGAKYEGVGWSNRSPQAAIEQCCYWGTRPTAQIGVSKGQDGCWYACVLYH